MFVLGSTGLIPTGAEEERIENKIKRKKTRALGRPETE